jgi:nitroreductase
MQTSATEMGIFQAILARRSVRNYTRQEVPQHCIMTLLAGAVRAPVVMDEEPCAFVVIQNRELLQALSAEASTLSPVKQYLFSNRHDNVKVNGSQTEADVNLFHDAGTLIIICAKADASFSEANCWLAAENLMLAACGMQLGSCIIGAALPAMQSWALKTKFGIPPQFEAAVPIVLGWPRGETRAMPRKSPVLLNVITSIAV